MVKVLQSAADARFTSPVRHLPHLAFFLIVGSSAARMLTLDNPLCWYIVSLSALLALCYVGGLVYWQRLGRRRPAWLGLLLLLWLMLVFVAPPNLTPAYAWCAVPLACIALGTMGRRSSIVAAAGITALLGLVLGQRAGWSEPDLVVAPIAAVWATLGFYRVQQRAVAARERLIDELRDTRAELALRQREAGMSAERARIARDIHDTLAQELAGSRMLLQAAERDQHTNAQEAWARIHAVVESLGESLVETRRIIDDLTPPALDSHGLEAALEDLCLRARRSGTAYRITFRGSTDLGFIAAGTALTPDTPELAATLLRVAQGALANVRDHACATNVTVTLGRLDGLVTLEVRDDGVGFDPDRIASAPGRGFGLAAIRERLRAYGGTVTVDSVPGRGTTLSAALPLRPAGRGTAAGHPPLTSVAGVAEVAG
jgi:signal transduction histidine kinase